jgi:hypothetical protein
MSRFVRAAARLRKRGAVPNVEVIGGGNATYLTVAGYNVRHVAASFLAGAVLALGLTGLFMLQTGYWIGTRDDAKLVDAVKASGIDIKRLSTGELAARLSYPPEIAEALTGLLEDSQSFVDHVVPWLRSMPLPQRRPAMQVVMELAKTIGSSPAKIEIAKSILTIDDATAQSLTDARNINGFLRAFASAPFENRQFLIEAGFPVRPIDSERARLWSVINHAHFPARVLSMVEPLAQLITMHPDRARTVEKFIASGAMSKPAPCISNRTEKSCQPGYYLSEQLSCKSYLAD